MKLFAVHSNIFTNPKDLSSEKDFLNSRRSLLLILCTKTEQNSRRQLHVHFFPTTQNKDKERDNRE